MRARTGTAMAIATAVIVAAVVLISSRGSSAPPTAGAGDAGSESPRQVSSLTTRSRGAREDCSTRSEANFPGAFTNSRNLVVGPLVLVGGAYTDARTVREFGGNKFPLLVKAGHTVTVRLARHGRRLAGLAYGPQDHSLEDTTLRGTSQSVTFVACRPGKESRGYGPDGPSGSYADGVSVTFWSGFVLTRAPACIPLDVYVDEETSPRRVGLALGRRCGR